MNKNTIIIVSLIVVVILGSGGLFLASKLTAKGPTPTPTPDTQQILSLNPSDIGLTLSPITSGKFAGNGVELRVTSISDISSIDYQLSYTAKGNIPRGAIGHVDIKSGDTEFKQQLYFGTCSDVCHPDADVTGVKVTMKVTKQDGKIYSVEAPFNQ